MSSVAALSIPCLGGTAKPYFQRDGSDAPLFDTKGKVALFACTLLAAIGLCLLPYLPAAAVGCLIASGLGFFSLGWLVHKPSPLDSNLLAIEKLAPAKQLAAGIDIPPALLKELEQVIPKIDMIEKDPRIANVHYNCDETATFSLTAAPGLQFRVPAASPRSYLGCEEHRLTRRYENIVYAHQICQREKYDSIVIPSIKPLYLTVGGLRRSLLVEKPVVPQKEPLAAKNWEKATRQAVQFLLKTGGDAYDCPQALPVEGGKLALLNLHHLTESPHPDAATRDHQEVELILGKRYSLLASLENEELIDIALDELKRLRPASLTPRELDFSPSEAAERRRKQIAEAKEARLQQLRTPPPPKQPEPNAPPNILGVAPWNLGLNLAWRDYAVIRRDGVHSDGICRPISLGETAQAIIERINRKLYARPTRADIEFTPEDMLIGEKLPSFTWEKHYQYNLLQGLGYRGWPNPNKKPPYWIELILQSLKNRGLVTEFSLPDHATPRLRVSQAALTAASKA